MLVLLTLPCTLSLAGAAGADDLSPNKEIMRITASGAMPEQLELRGKDGSVFLLNGTRDDLLTLSVDFGAHRPHCASSNMKFDSDGVMRSVKPIGPKDFAIMCFPESGTYKISIAGLDGGKSTRTATVIAK